MRISSKVSLVVFSVLAVLLFPFNAFCDEPLKGEVETHSDTTSLKGEVETHSGSPTLKGETGKSQSTAPLKGGAQATHPLQGEVSSQAPLKGFVGATGHVLPAIKLHMSKAELDSACKQYSADLRKFFVDVQDYHKAHEALKAQIGTCTENEQQWQLNLQKNKLNLNTVVIPVGIPDIPKPPDAPPVIQPPRACCARCLITGECGHLGTGGGSAPPPPGQTDARLKELTMEVARTQNQLRYAEQENGYTSQKAINEAQIEQSQQNLAEKFGRLKQQYDMLKIEKSALTGVEVK